MPGIMLILMTLNWYYFTLQFYMIKTKYCKYATLKLSIATECLMLQRGSKETLYRVRISNIRSDEHNKHRQRSILTLRSASTLRHLFLRHLAF
jgi:hypothetical protein